MIAYLILYFFNNPRAWSNTFSHNIFPIIGIIRIIPIPQHFSNNWTSSHTCIIIQIQIKYTPFAKIDHGNFDKL